MKNQIIIAIVWLVFIFGLAFVIQNFLIHKYMYYNIIFQRNIKYHKISFYELLKYHKI